jgi:competence protein ComEA
MRARQPCALLLSIGLPLGTIVAQTTARPARGEAADKADFESVCGACHTPGMVSDVRSEPEWKETVEHMVSLGATGTEEQMEAVMRFLLRTLTSVNINTATAGQLPLVLDISEITAQDVVKYRGEHGHFKTLDDLKRVPGIDAAKLDARKNRVVF